MESNCQAPVYVCLLHHPITNRRGELVTTAVTNMDLHDISRTCRTFAVTRFFLVTPIELQHVLIGRILGHWNSEQQRVYHPDRVEALSRAKLVRTFQDVKDEILAETGKSPEVVLTDARPLPNSCTYDEYRRILQDPSRTQPTVIVLGTGWGVEESFYPEVHRILAPVYGPEGDRPGGYNHLSVRAAAAIILDRLFGH